MKRTRIALLRDTTPIVRLEISVLHSVCVLRSELACWPPQEHNTNIPARHKTLANIHCRKQIQLRAVIDALPISPPLRRWEESMRAIARQNAGGGRIRRYHSVDAERPDRAIIGHNLGHNRAAGLHPRQQVHDQSDSHPKGAASSDEHGGGGAILDDLNLRMIFRLHVIGEVLDRRVEQLRRQHGPAAQRDRRPPDRLRPKDGQHEDRPGQCEELVTEAVLRTHGDGKARDCASQPQSERLILRSSHHRRILR